MANDEQKKEVPRYSAWDRRTILPQIHVLTHLEVSEFGGSYLDGSTLARDLSACRTLTSINFQGFIETVPYLLQLPISRLALELYGMSCTCPGLGEAFLQNKTLQYLKAKINYKKSESFEVCALQSTSLLELDLEWRSNNNPWDGPRVGIFANFKALTKIHDSSITTLKLKIYYSDVFQLENSHTYYDQRFIHNFMRKLLGKKSKLARVTLDIARWDGETILQGNYVGSFFQSVFGSFRFSTKTRGCFENLLDFDSQNMSPEQSKFVAELCERRKINRIALCMAVWAIANGRTNSKNYFRDAPNAVEILLIFINFLGIDTDEKNRKKVTCLQGRIGFFQKMKYYIEQIQYEPNGKKTVAPAIEMARCKIM